MSVHSLHLLEQLHAILPDSTRALCVGFSGGLDSTVLLHALVAIRAELQCDVRAVHVNHGLHPNASQWAVHCESLCAQLQVACITACVEVIDSGEGLEAAARAARYDVFRSMLRPDEVLLTAHHADDQLETVLLNLARGAGVRGLAAMPALQRLGRGFHARPLLDLDRAALHAWACARSLTWIEDASNQNEHFDRNYLRQAVVPLLRARWPSIAHAAARSARHLGEAAKLLDALAEADLHNIAVGPCLDVSKLETLTSVRRRNVLRSWLRHHGARAPSTRKLASIEHDILHAAFDRTPAIECDGLMIRRHRALLYCTPPLPAMPAESLTWSPEIPLELPGLGRLIATRHERGDKTWIVRFRAGGELLARNTHHQRLKKLLQELDVLPWWRGLVPLIYENDELLAVGDLWSHADAQVAIQWVNRPDLLARSDQVDSLTAPR